MTFTNVMVLFGGIAMFLFGMDEMGENLKDMAGNYLKKILAKLTENRFVAVLVGAGLTALIQSSNAICSMTVGFVNAGLMELERTVGILIGSKIGTTVTGQLIAFHISDYATLLIFIGVLLSMIFKKKEKIKYLGNVIASLGILFMGLGLMEESMEPLKDLAWFQELMAHLENPLLGVLFGIVFTTLMQSVSASVGILQMMMLAGIISFTPAFYVMMGMNIGASIAPILAAIGGRKDAKRVAAIVVELQVIGTIFFLIMCMFLPITTWLQATADDPSRQMANANTIYNVVMCLVTFPICGPIVWLSRKIIRGEDKEQEEGKLEFITEAGFSSSATCIPQIDAEVRRMENLVKQNIKIATDTFFATETYDKDKFMVTEKTVDFLNKGITDALIRCSALKLTDSEAKHVGHLFHVITDLERIGDHAENILDYANRMIEEKKEFSPTAQVELKELVVMVTHILDDACVHLFEPSQEAYNNIYLQEAAIDDLVDMMKENHVERLHNRECHSSQGLIFVETLTDLERVSDHALNIAQAAKVRYHYNGLDAPPVKEYELKKAF